MVKLNSTGLFLQGRLNSTRMPGKALLNLGGEALILQVMKRLSVVPADYRVLVTSHESADFFRPYVEEAGWLLFSGDSHNVLKRFVDAAHHLGVDTIIRATGDNPLSSSEIAIETLELCNKKNADLAYLSPVPYGSGVEVILTKALEKALLFTKRPYDLEHVTPYIYRNSQEFKIATDRYHNDEAAREDIRVTVDTREDFEKMNFFIKKLKERKLNMTLHSLVKVWNETNFINFRELLFVTSAGGEQGIRMIKRVLILAEKLQNKFNITITLLNESFEAINMIEKSGFHFLSLSSVKDKITQSGMYDRVISDFGDSTLEQMKIISSFGPIYAFDDNGAAFQESYCLINTGLTFNEKANNANYKGVEYTITNALRTQKKKNEGLKKILISFSVDEHFHLTSQVIYLLSKKKYAITIIASPFFNTRINVPDNVEIIYNPENLYDYISQADLVITSPGLTFLEALKIETPSLVIITDESQKGLISSLNYPYWLNLLSYNKESDFDADFNRKLQQMVEEECFSGKEGEKSLFIHNNIGSKLDDVINTIDFSSPSIVVCKNCCDVNTKVVARKNTYNMYHCSHCRMYFMQHFNETQKTYDADYFLDEYKMQYGKTYEEDREVIRAFAAKRIKIIKTYKPGKKLLDFGSGLGFFAELAKEEGFSPLCYDISPYAVQFTNEKLGIFAELRDQQYLESSEEKFDVITSWYTLEHLQDFEKFIFMASQHLNKDGVLALSTPNGNGYTIKKKFNEYIEKHPEDHYAIFNPPMLKKLLKKHGFKQIKVVITGVHPERIFPSSTLLTNKFAARVITFFIKLFGYGDTFEIYARK